jgi:uncharacterized protein (DUF58 family)
MQKRFPFEFEGVVRITRVGATYLFSTLVIGFASLNTGNNSLYIALAFLLATLLISGIASKGGLRNIRVTFVQVEEAWAGKPARGVLRVSNESRLWNMRDLLLCTPSMPKPFLMTELRRGEVQLVDVEFLFERRGTVRLSTVDLYTRYPFGLFLKKRRTSLTGEAIVYPRLIDNQLSPDAFSEQRGDVNAVNRQGAGHDIFGFREYIRGDSLRQVHWKKSASLGRWIMKQHQSDVGERLIVVVDPVLPDGRSVDAFEQMISAATTLIYESLGRKMDVSLLIGDRVWSTRTESSGRPLFEALALIEPLRFSVVPPLRRGTAIFSLRELYASQSA